MRIDTSREKTVSTGDPHTSGDPELRLANQDAIDRKGIDRISDKHRILLIAWLAAVIAVIVVLHNLRWSGPQFFGLTVGLEQTISFQHPVEVTHISVVEGEKVAQHEPLLEAIRYDLVSKQAIIDENIAEIRIRHHESIAATDAKLRSLRAESKARVAEITTQIDKLESQHRLNLKMMGDSSGTHKPGGSSADSPILAEIKGLTKARRHIEETLQAQIQNLETQLNDTIRPADMQIAELEKRKMEFNRQAGDLKVTAEFCGSVGSIFFKPGEQVPPFKPILTLHAEKPGFVKGYLHEKMSNNIQRGQTVWIQSTTSAARNEALIRGVVEGIGNRIVEFPDRLKRMSSVKVWGRELTIRLMDENHLLLDEKVRIFTEKPESLRIFQAAVGGWLSPLFAETTDGTAGTAQSASTPRPIQSRVAGLGTTQIEASGIVWDDHTGTYLVVSDESTHAVPVILEMNHQGEVISELPIEGIDAMDDMESISLDGTDLIVAASLNKNHTAPPEPRRRKMIRMRRHKDTLLAIGEIDLYEVLARIQADDSADPSAREFLRQAIETNLIETEAHAVVDGDLLLGFKNPQDHLGRTVIIRIAGIDELFSKKAHPVSEVWLNLALDDPVTGQATALSDMALVGDRLFLLSVLSRKGRLASYFWRYRCSRKKLSLLAAFPGKRAEGLTLVKAGRAAMVVFDAGGKAASEFQLIGVHDETP